MNKLNEFLKKVIYNCSFDITFNGDKQGAINKWAVKKVSFDQAGRNDERPFLETKYVNTIGADHGNIPEHILEKAWKYYVSSEKKYNVYQDNCPEILFPDDTEKYIYCLSAIYCRSEQEVYIYINAETPLRVWINGEMAAVTHYRYHVKPYTILQRLDQGTNTILVEKSIRADYSHIRDQSFVIGINPLAALLTDHNRRFIDDSAVTFAEQACFVIPDQAFFMKGEEIGITIMKRKYPGKQENDVGVEVKNSFEELILSLKVRTKQRFLLDLASEPEGVYKIEVHDLINDKRSGSAYIYIGDFKTGCDDLRKSVIEKINDSDEIAEALEKYAEIANTATGCYQLAPELMNERMYGFMLEKYAEIESALHFGQDSGNRLINNIFRNSAFLFRKSNIDGGSIAYGVFLPINYAKDRDYPLVVMCATGYAASRYPLPVPYQTENKIKDCIILNVVARGDYEHEFIYEAELQGLIKDIVSRFHIKRNRVYLLGVCLGAKGAFSLALKMPDYFAGMALVFGPAYYLTLTPYFLIYENRAFGNIGAEYLKHSEMDKEYINNIGNIPACHLALLGDFAGNVARDLYVTSCLGNCRDFCFADFLRDEFDELVNSFKLAEELIKNEKDEYPRTVNFTSYYRKYNKSYWVRIDNRKDLTERSFISAKIASEVLIIIKTENIAGFSLLLSADQLGLDRTVTVNVDGRDIVVRLGDYTNVSFESNSDVTSASATELDRDSFEALYFSWGTEVSNTGIKQVYMNKCVIIKADYYKEDRRAYLRKMFNQLAAPLSSPRRFYHYPVFEESEVDIDDLGGGNFILAADTRMLSQFQQMILDSTGIHAGSAYLQYKDRTFNGEYFALIKCQNPVNVRYCTVLLLFNSDTMQQLLTQIYASFQYHPLFENDIIIFNEQEYYCDIE